MDLLALSFLLKAVLPGMRVLLIHEVPGVGSEGMTCEVADGYARNYLFPNHFAVPVTSGAVAQATARTTHERRALAAELTKYQELAAALDGASVTIAGASTAAGKLYGGVTAPIIVTKLHHMGFVIDPAWVALPAPLKVIGDHEVPLRLPHGLEATITVHLVAP